MVRIVEGVSGRVPMSMDLTVRFDYGSILPWVRAIDGGVAPGPRMIVAGSYVSSTGGAGDARQFSTYVDVPLVRNLADGPDEISTIPVNPAGETCHDSTLAPTRLVEHG